MIFIVRQFLGVCHPERSKTMSEANRLAQSKDPLPAGAGVARSFNTVPRF
jgi:hypothetical protein